MRLPNAEKAVVDAKLQDYCLSTVHPEGRHKARVFYSVLGLGSRDAKELRLRYWPRLGKTQRLRLIRTPIGQRYVVDFVMRRGGQEATVRSSWIIRTWEDFPRLTSRFVL